MGGTDGVREEVVYNDACASKYVTFQPRMRRLRERFHRQRQTYEPPRYNWDEVVVELLVYRVSQILS